MQGGNEEEREGTHEGFVIFHVDWSRVELPYVFFSWILVTTTAKLGIYMSFILLKKHYLFAHDKYFKARLRDTKLKTCKHVFDV